MNEAQTANQIGGRATGALFFTGFGALWLVLGLYVREQLHGAAIAGLLLGAAALLLASLLLPRVPEDPAVSRAFNRINAAQWIAVGVLAFALARLHLDAYIPTAVAAVVGLHLIPLARLFRNRLHYATGALLLAWAAGSALLTPSGELQGVTALGTGAILWLSAAVTLAMGLRSARQTAPQPRERIPAPDSSAPAA
jgi:hypothetical protein